MGVVLERPVGVALVDVDAGLDRCGDGDHSGGRFAELDRWRHDRVHLVDADVRFLDDGDGQPGFHDDRDHDDRHPGHAGNDDHHGHRTGDGIDDDRGGVDHQLGGHLIDRLGVERPEPRWLEFDERLGLELERRQ